MRTIFHAAMFGGLMVAFAVGLTGCGSSNASQNKMGGSGTSGGKTGDNMMSNDKMSGDKMSGDKMSGKMAKDQTP